jgi:hypothetical protein
MKSSSIVSCTLPGILEIDYRVFLMAEEGMLVLGTREAGSLSSP